MSLGEVDEQLPDLREHARVLWRRRAVVVALPLAAVLVTLVVSLVQTPLYRATATIVVTAGGALPPPRAGAPQLARTAADLIRSRSVAARAIRLLRLDDSPDRLLGRIRVHTRPDSAVVAISVDAEHASASPPSPPGAKQIAAAVATAFVQLVRQRLPHSASGSFSAQVWDPAHVGLHQIAPRTLRNVLVALVLGLVGGVLAAFALDLFDRRLRTREAIEEAFGAPVVGNVGAGDRPAYEALAAGLAYLTGDRPLRSVGVAGAGDVAAGLAAAFARPGEPALLVETGVDSSPRSPGAGLADVLAGAADDAECIRSAPDVEGLDVLPPGSSVPDVESGAMADLLDRVAASYAHVVVAGPAGPLAPHVDGVIVAARPGRLSSDEARAVREAVAARGRRILGVVLV